MSKKFLKNIKNLKNLSMIVKDANKPAFNDIVEKYKNGKILRFDSAVNLVMKLSNARGTGQIKVKQTIANIDKPKSKQISKPKQIKSKLDIGIDDDEGVISKSVKSKKHQNPNPLELSTSRLILYVMFNLFPRLITKTMIILYLITMYQRLFKPIRWMKQKKCL